MEHHHNDSLAVAGPLGVVACDGNHCLGKATATADPCIIRTLRRLLLLADIPRGSLRWVNLQLQIHSGVRSWFPPLDVRRRTTVAVRYCTDGHFTNSVGVSADLAMSIVDDRIQGVRACHRWTSVFHGRLHNLLCCSILSHHRVAISRFGGSSYPSPLHSLLVANLIFI